MQNLKVELSDIKKIDPTNISEVQVLRVGKFNHQQYGEFEITPEILVQLKENFDKGVRGIDIAVDYFHESDGVAAGWVKEVILKEGNTQLWFVVDWTPEATAKLQDKHIRYLSADFTWDYQDNETGQVFGAVLNGAGLTNRPFVKRMNPILSESQEDIAEPAGASDAKNVSGVELADEQQQEGVTTMDLEQILEAVKTMSADDKAQLIQALGGTAEAPANAAQEMKDYEKKLSEKDEKIVELTERAETAEKASAFTALLAEGKACEAQREAFMSGDMAGFASAAVDLKFDESGSSSDQDVEEKDPEVELKEIATKLSEDKGIDMAKALREARHANPDLADKIRANRNL